MPPMPRMPRMPPNRLALRACKRCHALRVRSERATRKRWPDVPLVLGLLEDLFEVCFALLEGNQQCRIEVTLGGVSHQAPYGRM